MKLEEWDANLANFSLSLIFSPSIGITCALLHILLKAKLKQTLDQLKGLKQITWAPFIAFNNPPRTQNRVYCAGFDEGLVGIIQGGQR